MTRADFITEGVAYVVGDGMRQKHALAPAAIVQAFVAAADALELAQEAAWQPRAATNARRRG